LLISEFARVTGLPVDTVRFYISRGLIKPEFSSKGGSRPYQIFTQANVTAALMIKLQKSLGFSLKEIARINEHYESKEQLPDQTALALREQITRLEAKQASVTSALDFLNAKLAWIESGKPAGAPQVQQFIC
jgi:MerR family transcriptional regulator, copper efflux regulator